MSISVFEINKNPSTIYRVKVVEISIIMILIFIFLFKKKEIIEKIINTKENK